MSRRSTDAFTGPYLTMIVGNNLQNKAEMSFLHIKEIILINRKLKISFKKPRQNAPNNLWINNFRVKPNS